MTDTTGAFGTGPFGEGPFGPKPAGGTNFAQAVTANITVSASVTKSAGKIVTSLADLAAAQGAKQITHALTSLCDAGGVVTKAVLITLAASLADCAATVTKDAGKRVTGNLTVMAMLGNLQIVKTVLTGIDVAALATKAITTGPITVSIAVTATVIKAAGKIVTALGSAAYDLCANAFRPLTNLSLPGAAAFTEIAGPSETLLTNLAAPSLATVNPVPAPAEAALTNLDAPNSATLTEPGCDAS